MRLHDYGVRLTLVDSLIPEYGGNLYNVSTIANEVKINISDVRDQHSLKYLLAEQDIVFNLAGQTSHMDSMSDPATDLEINCRAQLSILETLRHYNPEAIVVYPSTRQIYGRPQRLPVDETHPLHPVDVNGINKMAGEWYHILYNEVYGLRTSSLRLTNTIGPRMRIKDARQTFLGVWVREILMGKPIEVWGGEQLRDFTDVEDAIDALLLASVHEQAYGKIYNVGGFEPISLKNLAELLIEINGSGDYIVKEYPTDRKKIDIGNYYADYSLIKADLDWNPCISLRKSLERIIEYYRKHMKHYVE